MIHENILGTIGNTPMVRIRRLVPGACAEIFAKLESFNPGGSVKDRIGFAMIEAAEASGALRKGMTIVEPTSGNTGIGLALAAAVKGYRVVFTMPESMSIERRKLLVMYGAEIVLVKPHEGLGMTGAIARAEDLARAHGWFQPRQFENPANPGIHRTTTAQEIISDFEKAEKKVDVFVAGVGTGGTITGVGEVLKERYPHVRIIAVEPESSAVLSGAKPGLHSLHKIQGIGAGFVPEVLNRKVINEVHSVSDKDAIKTARLLAKKEGILAGISAGAALFATCAIAQNPGNRSKSCRSNNNQNRSKNPKENNTDNPVKNHTNNPKNIVIILPDTGERYISTELFEKIL